MHHTEVSMRFTRNKKEQLLKQLSFEECFEFIFSSDSFDMAWKKLSGMQDFHSNRKHVRASQSPFSPHGVPTLQFLRTYRYVHLCVSCMQKKLKRMTASEASQWCMVNFAVCGTLYGKKTVTLQGGNLLSCPAYFSPMDTMENPSTC